jgi:hypothetical protein
MLRPSLDVLPSRLQVSSARPWERGEVAAWWPDPAPAVPGCCLAGPWSELARPSRARGRPTPRPLWPEIAEMGPVGARGRPTAPAPTLAEVRRVRPHLADLARPIGAPCRPFRTRPGRRSPSRALPEIVAGGRQAGHCGPHG